MIITVFGASGNVGKQVVNQGLRFGHTIKAFGRNIESLIDHDLKSTKLQAVKGYIFDEEDVLNAIQGSDAVISVLGGAFDGADKTRSLGMKNIAAAMIAAGVKRIVALGGVGVLNADEDFYILDQPDYPEEYLPVGKEHLLAFEHLKASNLDWTFVCSPEIKNHTASGRYTTNANFPPLPDNGYITAGDLAAFMLQEMTSNHYKNKRVGISNVN